MYSLKVDMNRSNSWKLNFSTCSASKGDDTYKNADDVVKFFALIADTFKYDALFPAKDQLPHNHPIWKIPNLPIIGMTKFIDAIKHIANTKMVKINETSLIYH